ncbi:hypothetical protein D3C78_1240420 [compost metagenome]
MRAALAEARLLRETRRLAEAAALARGRLMPARACRLGRRRLRLLRLRLATAAEQSGEETAAALLGRAVLAALEGFDLRFQLLDPGVQLLDGVFLHDDRLGHVVGRRRLAGDVLVDQRFGLGLAGRGLTLGGAQAGKQAIDQTFLFSVHACLFSGLAQLGAIFGTRRDNVKIQLLQEFSSRAGRPKRSGGTGRARLAPGKSTAR